MATKKAASSAKKSSAKASSAKKQNTKVTTVKAVESRPAAPVKAARKRSLKFKFGLSSTPLVAALVAEFVGTFIFAATILASQGQPIVALFALAGVVLAIGTISGGYANPALVLGAWVTRRMSGIRAIAYIVAQVLGAMLALVVLDMYVSSAPDVSQQAQQLGQTAPELFKLAALPDGKQWLVFLSEFIGTLIFGFAVAGATREKKDRTAAALTVGLGVFLGLVVASYAAQLVGVNGAIINPAVAVSLQTIDFSSVWPITVYVVGSALGAVVGFILYDMLRGTEKEDQTA